MNEMVLARLPYDAPLLIVYLMGLYLALMMRRRYPKPCRLMGAGSAILLFVALLDIFRMNLFAVVEELRLAIDAHWPRAWIFDVVAVAVYFVQPLGVALLLAAVLVGRSQSQAER